MPTTPARCWPPRTPRSLFPPIPSSRSGSRSRWRESGAATHISSYSPTTTSGRATASSCTPRPAASTALARATRQWDDEEWSAATARLVARGWLDSNSVLTDAGRAARERIEVETDEHCAALWAPIGNAGARRFASLIAPITDAFTAAGTFQTVSGTA